MRVIPASGIWAAAETAFRPEQLSQVNYFMERFQEPEEISQEDVQADTGFIFYAF